MDIKVIPQYRALLFPCLDIGTVTENKATTLHFLIPEELNDYPERKVIVSNTFGNFTYSLVEDSLVVPNESTLSTAAEIQLICSSDGDKIWKSQKYSVNFYEGIEADKENLLDELKKQWISEAQRPLTILVNRLTETFKNLNTKRSDK